MTRTTTMVLLSAVLGTVGLALAASSPAQEGGTWSLDYGDPGHSGEHTTKVTVTYTDAEGKQQETTFTGKITITDPGGTGAVDKKNAAQAKLQQDVDAKKVDDQPLISLSGGGDVMTVTPNTAHSTVDNIKIKAVDTEDKKTKNKDDINPPGNGLPTIGIIEARGSITGLDDAESGSFFYIVSSQGVDTIPLDGNMSKRELVEAIAGKLAARTSNVWVWSEQVYVLLDGETISSLGAGTNDTGVSAVAAVVAAY